jgi:RimJ/RimL family protein N-acetyltransferase
VSLPLLTTARMSLVPVSDEHLDLLVDLNSDTAVMRYLLGRAATPDETYAEWEQRLGRQSDDSRGLGYWVGLADGEFVGWFSASSFADDPAASGIGYRLRRAAWGHGYATEGATATLAQAFAEPSIERVLASTMAVNVGSRRVLEKLGLRHVETYVGEWRDAIEGWEEGEVVYSLTRAEADLDSPAG